MPNDPVNASPSQIAAIIDSPAQKLRKLEDMTIQDIKDALILSYRRRARAEEDKKYYTSSYNEVIKEEKEVQTELLGRLEFLYEANRLQAARDGWVANRELGDVVEETRDAIEQGDKERLSKGRGFLRAVTADGEGYDPETGLLEGQPVAAQS